MPIILVAAFIDFIDGYLARRLKVETRIGCILDCVADFICFILAVSFYVFMENRLEASLFLIVSCVVYVMAGSFRLIRYAVLELNRGYRDGFFSGCPTTVAALCVIFASVLYDSVNLQAAVLLACSFFMVIGVKYISSSKIVDRYKKSPFLFIYIVLSAPFFIFYPLEAFFVSSAGYILFFPFMHLISRQALSIRRSPFLQFLMSPFAKKARHSIVMCFIFLVLSIIYLPFLMSVFYLLCFLTSVFIFRDPERINIWNNQEILSPADGRVVDIETVFDKTRKNYFVKIGIFLSIFDVHVNRAPAKMYIQECRHHDGKHIDARHPRAVENEHNIFTCELEDGRLFLLKQIAGRFARRVISYVNKGDVLDAGDRLGVILFGSRVELFVPQDVEVLVREGDRVKAGMTTIGVMR